MLEDDNFESLRIKEASKGGSKTTNMSMLWLVSRVTRIQEEAMRENWRAVGTNGLCSMGHLMDRLWWVPLLCQSFFFTAVRFSCGYDACQPSFLR